MTTTLPANPNELAEAVIRAAYGHLGDIVRLSTGHNRIKAPRHAPAILIRPGRDVPTLSANRLWARSLINVATFSHEEYVELPTADLWIGAEVPYRINPGYLPEEFERYPFRMKRRKPLQESRDMGLYRVDHSWQIQVRLSAD